MENRKFGKPLEKDYTKAFVKKIFDKMYDKNLEELMSRVIYREGGLAEYQRAKQNAEYLARHEALTDTADILDLRFGKVQELVSD